MYSVQWHLVGTKARLPSTNCTVQLFTSVCIVIEDSVPSVLLEYSFVGLPITETQSINEQTSRGELYVVEIEDR